MRTMSRDVSMWFVLQSASLVLSACSSSSPPYAPRHAVGDAIPTDGSVAAETPKADQALAGDLVSPDVARAVDTVVPDVPLTHDAPVLDGPAQDDVASSGDARTLDGSAHDLQVAEAAPSDASGDGVELASDASANACMGTYESCICACCDTVRAVACYFPTAGETIADLRAADEAKRAQTICGTCTAGTNYVCCMPAPPEAASSATYTADGYSGGMDHLAISKSGSDCASVEFVAPSKGRDGFRIDAGTRWAAAGAQVSTCGDPDSATPVKWALGTLSFRVSGSTCLIDLHATLFRISESGQISTTRMDADGIPFPSGMPSGLCK